MTATALVGNDAAQERARMRAVRRYDILDTPPDGSFDRVTRLAAKLLHAPIAIVTIVDHDRIWFKSRYGIEAEEITRDPGLCASAILHDEPWVVEDARRDPRALANPLVAGEFGLQFYAGAPLRTVDGHNLGTLCVIDMEPRVFGDTERSVLADLADIVVDELELRLAARDVETSVRERQALMEERQRQALQLNDDVVQALAVAKMELQMGVNADIGARIDHALESGKRILADMASDARSLRRDETGPIV